jgi:hypothetical protein
MRSRLEARWARWFDLQGWEWEYEPLDLAGWLPDFALTVPEVGALLVECKPALSTDRLTAAGNKAERATTDTPEHDRYPVLLLGASPKVVLVGAAPKWSWLPPAWWPTGSMSAMGWADAVNKTQWRPRRR